MKRLLFLALPGLLAAQLTVQLTPETGRAFDEYVKAVAPGLWESIGREEIQSREKGPREVPGGLIHDWTGAVLAPGTRLEKALALLQDYDNYKKVYQPEVLDSRLIGRDRNHYRAYLKLKKKKVLTVVLNTEYEIDYQPDGPPAGAWRHARHASLKCPASGNSTLAPGTGSCGG